MKKFSLLFCLLLSALGAWAESLFESRSAKELMEENSQILSALIPKSENPSPLELRLGQILILQDKKLSAPCEPLDIIWYLDKTQKCLLEPDLCKNTIIDNDDDKNEHLRNFYTKLTEPDLEQIKKSFAQIDISDFRRIKIINLFLHSLKLGIQEIDAPNDDSLTGNNFITQIFEGAGVFEPQKQLPSSRIEWAWCSAYITSIINQAGLGFSFISVQEHLNACKEADSLEHCHPIQVEFILNWARTKNILKNTIDTNSLKAGDILILVNPKTKKASHIGFYLAQSPECKNLENTQNCYIYSLEGNAGPFINDKLEDDWATVSKIIKENNISQSEHERLLDRLTIAKRPIQSWDYTFIAIPK